MGLIELLKLAFADDTIFIPLDSEYTVESTGKYIWDEEQIEATCRIKGESNHNIEKLRDLIENGLPEEPEGEAPEFKINGRDE